MGDDFDPISIAGMSDLFNTDSIKEGTNIKDIERSVINSGSGPYSSMKSRPKHNPLNDFSNELNGTTSSTHPYTRSVLENSMKQSDIVRHIDDFSDDYGSSNFTTPSYNELSSYREPSYKSSRYDTSNKYMTNITYPPTDNRPSFDNRMSFSSGDDTTMDEIDKLLKEIDIDANSTSNNPSSGQFDNSFGGNNASSLYNNKYEHKDPYLHNMTEEECRRKTVMQAYSNRGNTSYFDIEKSKIDDEKTRMLEEIDEIRSIFESNDDKMNADRVQHVTINNSVQEIKSALDILKLKNDRARCAVFGNELFIGGAKGLGYIFNGKRSFMGVTPDLVGWDATVASKIRRMKCDTANVVSGIINKMGLGSLSRMMLELVPSMFMYSRLRASQRNDNLAIDEQFKSSLRDMTSTEEEENN